jgi:hypothetical protein
MKTQIKKQQNQTNSRIKVLIGVIAAISILMFNGCQDTSIVTNVGIPLQKESVSSDKGVTLAVVPDDNSTGYTDQTQSTVEKIMSIYENSNTSTLRAKKVRGKYQDIKCVPILVIAP